MRRKRPPLSLTGVTVTIAITVGGSLTLGIHHDRPGSASPAPAVALEQPAYAEPVAPERQPARLSCAVSETPDLAGDDRSRLWIAVIAAWPAPDDTPAAGDQPRGGLSRRAASPAPR